MTIITVTGHRPPKLGGYRVPNPVYDAVVEAIDNALMTIQPTVVYVGMALGVDQWAAEICARNGVPFIAAVPFNNFDRQWPQESRDRFRELLGQALQVVVTTDTENYSSRLMNVRNRYMVDRSQEVVAVWNGQADGGTFNCLSYARQTHKPVRVVPLSQEIWHMAAIHESSIAVGRRNSESNNWRRIQEEARRLSPVAQAARQTVEDAQRWAPSEQDIARTAQVFEESPNDVIARSIAHDLDKVNEAPKNGLETVEIKKGWLSYGRKVDV